MHRKCYTSGRCARRTTIDLERCPDKRHYRLSIFIPRNPSTSDISTALGCLPLSPYLQLFNRAAIPCCRSLAALTVIARSTPRVPRQLCYASCALADNVTHLFARVGNKTSFLQELQFLLEFGNGVNHSAGRFMACCWAGGLGTRESVSQCCSTGIV